MSSSASSRLDQHLQADSDFKSLYDLLKVTPHQITLSGLQDNDYPNNTIDLSRKVPLVSNITCVPLPLELVEQFSNMQQSCELGLFPEIARAWITVDSNIFVWAYDNASDVAYYDGLDQTIVSVCLLKPRIGVFKPHIKYLLCLTTALEVTLLGVTFAEEDTSIQATVLLIPDPIFKIATDNVILSTVAGTEDGRIFLGGNDGCLYEIVYQAEGGWFSSKCRKVNHSTSIMSYMVPSFLNFGEQEPIVQVEIDDSRHLLYLRTDKCTIQMFDLGYDGQSTRQVTSKSWSSVVNQASHIAKTIDVAHFKPLIGIKVLTSSESDKLHLVALTQGGVRLYFSAPGERPYSLDLVHIRLPPGFTPTSIMPKPNSVNNLFCRDGTYIMTSSQSEDKDLLWTMTNDCYVYENQMMEAFNVNALGGKVWRIAEECRPRIIRNQEKRTLPLAVTQQFEDRRKFVLLTSQSVHIFYKNRPVDQLSRLLAENQGIEAGPVKAFFQNRPSEACLTSLVLACTSKLPQEIQLVEWATLAFVRYGGEPRLVKVTITNGGTSSNHVPLMSTPNNSSIQTLNSNLSPIIADYHDDLNGYGIEGHQQMEIKFSARHEAIYTYFSRILRPIWSMKVAATKSVAPGHECLTNIVNSEEILLILKRFIELKQFLASSSQLSVDNNKPNKFQGRIEAVDPKAHERESINALTRLLNRSIEVLNLYQLLYEHDFSVVCATIPVEQQLKLINVTFKDLIVVGGELTSMIASALVRRYLDDNITTDAISRKLHELCPSVFRQENALHAKAHELVLQARNLAAPLDRDKMMSEALILFKKIGARLDLQSVCELLLSSRAYKHIVDICLYIADKRDPQNLAGHYHNRPTNNTMEDNEERNKAATAFQDRMDCYGKIIDTLERLLSAINSSIPYPMNVDNQEVLRDQAQIRTRDEAVVSFDEVINTAIRSTDELFHYKLYDWLCDHKLSAKLLDIQSSYLECFLKQKSTCSERPVAYLDLLWRYYERRGNKPRAAQVLDKLASRATTEYDLSTRLEYLSRAIICMQSSGSSVIISDNMQKITPGELLHEIEEKMEVARIQLQILERIKDLPESPVTYEAISQLNYTIIELTPLYESFAKKFNLYDCQLAILKCAGHYDQTLIEKLWQNIIDNIIHESCREAPEAQLLLLGSKISSLAQMLMPSESYIPAYFIVSYVEFKTKDHENIKWFVRLLTDIGFSPATILDIYHRFYKSRESLTFWPKKSIHVLRVVANFIEEYLDRAGSSYRNIDKSFAAKSLDVICGFLIDIQSTIATDRNLLKLLDDYKTLQSRLNKIIN